MWVVSSDPAWPKAFQREAAALRQALGSLALRIEHVDSTSVPGLDAKPIIDIQISVVAVDPMEPCQRPLEGLGYRFVPDPESPDYHFFGKPSQRPRTHHVHVCAVGSQQELRHLALRDFLRAHASEAAAYTAMKRSAAARHRSDRLGYISVTGPFVEDLERRAMA